MAERQLRVLVAKPGLDGHDRGAKVVAMALRDAGADVIYLGLRQTPESILRSAADEDVDVIGLSILSGAHMTLTRRLLALRGEFGLEDVPVAVGGTIPPADAEELRREGAAVFPVGTPIPAVTEGIFQLAREGVTAVS